MRDPASTRWKEMIPKSCSRTTKCVPWHAHVLYSRCKSILTYKYMHIIIKKYELARWHSWYRHLLPSLISWVQSLIHYNPWGLESKSREWSYPSCLLISACLPWQAHCPLHPPKNKHHVEAFLKIKLKKFLKNSQCKKGVIKNMK